MTTVLGQLDAFNPESDSVTVYIERVHLFFTANNIPDKKTVPVFLSTSGWKSYEHLRNFIAPTPPETLKLSELTGVLKCHYEPKPLTIAERLHFHCRYRAPDETIAEFVAELRQLSTHCDFESYRCATSWCTVFVTKTSSAYYWWKWTYRLRELWNSHDVAKQKTLGAVSL